MQFLFIKGKGGLRISEISHWEWKGGFLNIWMKNGKPFIADAEGKEEAQEQALRQALDGLVQ